MHYLHIRSFLSLVFLLLKEKYSKHHIVLMSSIGKQSRLLFPPLPRNYYFLLFGLLFPSFSHLSLNAAFVVIRLDASVLETLTGDENLALFLPPSLGHMHTRPVSRSAMNLNHHFSLDKYSGLTLFSLQNSIHS